MANHGHTFHHNDRLEVESPVPQLRSISRRSSSSRSTISGAYSRSGRRVYDRKSRSTQPDVPRSRDGLALRAGFRPDLAVG